MNEQQKQTSEKIASKILRALAIIGLVAVLALIAWTVVQGAKSIPNLGNNLSTIVTSVQNIFKEVPEESLALELDTQTIAVGNTTEIKWDYVGENNPKEYDFSYTCGTNVELSVIDGTGWKKIECNSLFKVKNNNIKILANNTVTRFADIKLSISANNLTDTTNVTVVNTDITDIDDLEDNLNEVSESDVESTAKTTTTENTSNTATNSTNNNTQSTGNTTQTNNKSSRTVIKNTKPLYEGPSDLVLSIKETGILLDVDGEDVFFPVSPIPSDKVAAVVFTVTNKGGDTSKIWSFKAKLPIEGDDAYTYESPKQVPITSGMEVEYTLGFDEVLKDRTGEISILLKTNYAKDKTSNNTDSVSILIKS